MNIRPLPASLNRSEFVMAILALCAAWSMPGLAQTVPPYEASSIDTIQITATRFGDPVQQVPNSMVVITADELAERGVRDLRGALANVAGISVGPGGDDGSAGVSLGLLGRRETDDFLLVIDGVPAGGAFTPQFATLNFHGVERIEVIRGTSPVYFGTTAFAGTISIIHFAAGRGGSHTTASVGNHGSYDLGGDLAMAIGSLSQSLAFDETRVGVEDPRAGFRRVHGAYRAAAAVGYGQGRLDFDLTSVHDRPTSPTPYSASGEALLPALFNENPVDAHIDTTRAVLSAGYDRPFGAATWSSLVSLATTHTDTVRGFLDLDAPRDADVNAAGYAQGRRIIDLFADTHLTQALTKNLDITYGLNLLQGRLSLHSRQFEYQVPLDGGAPPESTGLSTTDNTRLVDRRALLGVYSQWRWKPGADVNVLGGLRWNHTDESREAYGDAEGADRQVARNSRFTGSVGANWWAWRDATGDLDDLSLYVNLGNTFQPPQVDFGSDAQIGAILRPETLRSTEVGAKLDGLDGRFDLALSAFIVDVANRPLNTTVSGESAVVAGGQERFKGLLIDANLMLARGAKLSLHYALSRAIYGNFETQPDGADSMVQLAGKRLELVPDHVFSGGAVLGESHGWHASVAARWISRRFLDPQNQAAAGSFVTVDAQAGFRWRDGEFSLSVDNAGNRRDLVVASELGSSQAYRTPGRRFAIGVSRHFD